MLCLCSKSSKNIFTKKKELLTYGPLLGHDKNRVVLGFLLIMTIRDAWDSGKKGMKI